MSIDLIARRSRGPKEQRSTTQYQYDRRALGSSSEDADDEKDEASDSSSAPSQSPPDTSPREKTERRPGVAEKIARRRKRRQQRKERIRRRQKEERWKEDKEKRWEKILEKNDEIMEWRDTFEVGEKPKGIEKQFPVRSVIPGPREHRWLVPARTSRTMLECA